LIKKKKIVKEITLILGLPNTGVEIDLKQKNVDSIVHQLCDGKVSSEIFLSSMKKLKK